MKQNKFSFFLIDFSLQKFKDKYFLDMFISCFVKKSINISDYGYILVCGAIYSQNVVLKTFLIWNDTLATRRHLVDKSELFGRFWFDPAIGFWSWNLLNKKKVKIVFLKNSEQQDFEK